jgi:hypothetical protein
MSSSLSWEPPPSETEKHYIGLKYEIGRYFDPDWNGNNGSWTGDSSLIPFLKGIVAVGQGTDATDALQLIDAIEKYGEVILTIS